VGKICDFQAIRLSETGRAIWRPLASVKETLLLGLVMSSSIKLLHLFKIKFPTKVLFGFLKIFLKNNTLTLFCNLFIEQIS